MWRTLLAVAVLSLALGNSAVACPSCGAKTVVNGVSIDSTDSSQTLIFLVQPAPGATLPESGTAVLMTFNGNRSKCLNVPVLRGSVDSNGNTAYRGGIPTGYGGARGSLIVFTGRVDLAGDVYEFSASTDGKPGNATIVTDGSTVNQVGAPTAAPVITPQAVVTTAPTLAPASATQASSDPWAPLRQPMTLLAILAVAATIAGAFIDRRRALAKATA